MKRGNTIYIGDVCKRFISVLLAIAMIIAYMPLAETPVVHAESSAYEVIITEEINAESGFKHPGIGLTKDILENVRYQVQNKVEPWYSYYVSMSNHSFAAKDVTSNNQSGSDPTKPNSVAFDSQGFNSRFIADGLKAYTQALMYVITGEEIYRANGMRIIRIWSQMDPEKYVYFTDAHIHTGIPLNRMATAAEILRYTSSPNPDLAWTEQDTEDFTNNLVMPTINTFMFSKDRFMNQHSYSVLGAMAGYLFADDKAGYEQQVEWWSVNKDAIDQGYNGSIKQLFRLIDKNDLTGEPVDPPVIQHVEMGRDQAHGGGDLTNAAITVRMLHAQGTKLDPVTGTASTDANAVEPMAFLDHRIIKAADYFWQFMLGYEPDWVPVAYSIAPDGTVKDTYNRIASGYKGRFATTNFWDFYSYYTYERGENIEEIAPYYAEAFTKKQFQNWQNVDGGEEFWLYLPAEAAADAERFLPPQQPSLGERNEVEIRYTALDANTEKRTETAGAEEIQFIRFNATEAGAKIALLSGGTGSKTIGFKIRSNGIAQLDVGGGIKDTLTLPNTHGQWRYVTYTMNEFQGIGDFYELSIRGANGVVVDLDHISFVAAELDAPKFKLGNADSEIFSYVGVPISMDFSATGAEGAVMTYEGEGLPAGAQLNAETGEFSWEQPVVGQHAMVVTVSDGRIVTTKNVVIHLSANRSSAIEETIAPYDAQMTYVAASLARYQAVYEDTISKSATQTDSEFVQQLLTLRAAVEGLELVSPRAFDGSLDYTKVVSSNMGTGISLLLDDDNDTFTGFASGHGASQTLDFGTDYKVTASSFGVQSRMNFTDRGAGVAIFASNDNVNWTRITSGETIFNSGMNYIEVDEQYRNEQYRFIRYQMVTRHPDIIHNSVQSILELGEFRIFGERHEIGNKLELISFAADQGIRGRITQGDAATLTIKAKEPISDVQVTIQGVNATLTTLDQINWTATATLNSGVTTGPVTIKVDYKKQDGSQGATMYATTDNSRLYFMDESDVIQNLTEITTLIDSTTNRTAQGTLDQVNSLFDGNPATGSDFRNGSGGAGNGSYITFDFKKGNQALISSVEFLARQDGNYGRIGGAVVQGSNDNVTWTTLTNPAASTLEWQTLASNDANTLYRYIRIYNGNAWFGNMNELRLHGKVVSLFTDLLSEAEAVDRTIYTDESLAVLDTAVLAVETVLANESATQTDLNAASVNLQVALTGLVYKPGMPVLELTDKFIKVGSKLTFDVQAVNVDEAVTAVFEVEDLPEGALFNAATGAFEWTPADEQGGIHTVTFKVEANGLSSEKMIKIKVIGKPIVDSSSLDDPMEVTAENAITYQVPVASDPSGEALTFSAVQLPAGATLNPTNGTLKWTPNNGDYGVHAITFKVSNGSFEVEVLLQINVALHVLPARLYTRASYHVYAQELERIEAAMQLPTANKRQLAYELNQAEGKLISATTLPLEKVAVQQSMVTASTGPWGGSNTEEARKLHGWNAYDSNTGTFVDTQAASGWVIVDFGQGNEQHVDLFKLYPRGGYATRVNDASLQGSNDGNTWDTLYTISGINTVAWHTMLLSEPNAYRYYRYYAPSGNTNVAEIELIKISVDTTLLDELLDKADAIQAELYMEEGIELLNERVAEAQSLLATPAYTQQQIDDMVELLLTAFDELQLMPKASLTGDSSLMPGQALNVSLFLMDNVSDYNILDLIVKYDPSIVQLAMEKDLSDKWMLSEEAISLVHRDVQLLGTAVVPEAGEIRMLLAVSAASNSDNSGNAGAQQASEELQELLQLHGVIAGDVLPTTTTISLKSFAGIIQDKIYPFNIADAQLTVTVTAADHSALQAAIQQAKQQLAEAVIGTAPGQYPQSAADALQAAIDAAEAVTALPNASEAQINEAIAALQAALTTFGAAKNPPATQEPKPNVPSDPLTQGNKAALQQAIITAKSLHDRAVEGRKLGTYNAGSKAALQQAIEAAELILYSFVDQSKIDGATADLNRALEAFKKQLVSLVAGQTQITTSDLAVIASFYRLKQSDANWQQIELANLVEADQGENIIDIRDLAAIAQLILDEWAVN